MGPAKIKSKSRLWRLLLCCLLLLPACEKDPDAERPGVNSEPEAGSDGFRSGVIRVKFKTEPKIAEEQSYSKGTVLQCGLRSVDLTAGEVGAYKMQRVFRHTPRFEERTRQAGLHLWYDIYFDSAYSNSRAGELYRRLPDIEYTEQIPDVISTQLGRAVDVRPDTAPAKATGPFDDPSLWLQWHYNSSYLLSDAQFGADINLFEAWKVSTGSPDVIVAVVDGGVDVEHEDLKRNIWVNAAELNGRPGIDDDRNGYTDDVYGWNFVANTPVIQPTDHGTHVAGTIAAENGNGKGGCGIAGGEAAHGGARIMVCQILQVDRSDKETWAQNIPEAIKYGADNGAVISQNSWMFKEVSAGTSRAVAEAINYFITYAGTDATGVQTGPVRGGIVVFAAGNQNKPELPQPVNHPAVLPVAAVNWNYQRSSYSNYHSAVALSAPGGESLRAIFSTLKNNRYGYMEGTSMAAPHVSGVAALVVARYGGPGFTAGQLRSRLEYAPQEIDSYNPQYAGSLGAGLVDAATALKTDGKIPPEKAGLLKIELHKPDRSAVVSWTVPSDEDDGVPTRCVLYWSTKPFDGVNLEAPSDHIGSLPVDTRKKKAGDQVFGRATDLQVNIPYYFAVVAVDRWGNRSAFDTMNATIESENIPPVVSVEIEDFVLTYRAGEKEIDLNRYFSDTNGDRLIYTCQMSASTENCIAYRLDQNLLTFNPLGTGTADMTVRATDPGNYWVEARFRVMVRSTVSEAEIYPNPTRDFLNLSLGFGYAGPVHLRVHQVSGEEVLSRETELEPFGFVQIDVSRLVAGTYVLIVDAGTKRHTLKFIKL